MTSHVERAAPESDASEVASAALVTVIFVSYATASLDLAALPGLAPVVVVHNDDSLAESGTPERTRHIRSTRNVGFGAAVNLALESIDTPRLIVCNPDCALSMEHWQALMTGGDDDVVVLPLTDRVGHMTSVVNRYPTPLTHLLSGYRAGRLVRRETRLRRLLVRALGRWGSAHSESLVPSTGARQWDLRERWFSGAAFSIATSRLRGVGGFDEDYFLYYEDVDLGERLASAWPSMRVVLPAVAPGVHEVGGSARRADVSREVERTRLASAVRYASRKRGLRWRACCVALKARSRLLGSA